jgi:hypothetical protein
VRTGCAAALTLLALGAGAVEAQVYTFERPSYSAAEDVPLLEVCVVRTGDLSQRIDALVSTADGTATSGFPGGLDFLPWNDVPFQFPAGTARRCGLVGIFDDDLEEGEERFTVRISHVFPPGQVGVPGAAEVSILDDDAPPEDVRFGMTDNGHLWGDDPVIPYEITIENNGPPRSDLVVTEVVPVQTTFVAAASTPGWSCAPGPDEGSACRFPLGALATGERRVLEFAARVRPETPPEFEVFNEASLAGASGPPLTAVAGRWAGAGGIGSVSGATHESDRLVCAWKTLRGLVGCCLFAILGFPCDPQYDAQECGRVHGPEPGQ